ncbi:MAG: preprotein translocase subunit YajC [Candidatus Marinimicrobia bacterium]|nr:preprotein translocase subunit YajC [Candidatus Neomarinimicrobiota bacterium]|tara:strand:- start:372 stop:695 length:324 start_codon:yes stop_codon:yes gene_type:complete
MDILFAQQTADATTSIISSLPPLILMFLIFYFIVIRPQTKERKEHEEQLNSLVKGDRVLSSGGVLGKIVEFQGKDNDIIIIDTECNGKLKMKKSFILKKLNSTKDNS